MNKPEVFHWKGPLLLACNHPNSFLDAIIIGSQFEQPVHFLARGDAFKKPFVKRLLTSLKLIPIYRLSEGRENLALNDATFEKCREVLLNNGILLIFSEGLCINDWKLRPLKKGTARIAIDAWQQFNISDEFRVLPVGINYNSFDHLGKQVILHFYAPLTEAAFTWSKNNGELIQQFNQRLAAGLQHSIIETHGDDAAVQFLISNNVHSDISKLKYDLSTLSESAVDAKMQAPYYIRQLTVTSFLFLVCLAIPAIVGVIFHLPLYYVLKRLVKRKTEGTVFYDSVLFGLLLVTYPLYYAVINLIAWNAMPGFWPGIACLLLPAFAWVAIKYKLILTGVVNNLKLDQRERKMFERFH